MPSASAIWPTTKPGPRRQVSLRRRNRKPTLSTGTQKPRYDCSVKSIQSSICVDLEILSGTPVFDGTRVPVQTLMDYLKVGDCVDDFLDDFPTVSREQIAAVLDVAGEAVSRYARIA